MKPSSRPPVAPGARRSRRLCRLAAACVRACAALLLWTALAPCTAAPPQPGSAAQDLARLDALVRSGAGDALPRLLAAEAAHRDDADYADRLGYLRLLAQAYRDAGRLDDAYAVDTRIARLAGAHGDTVNAALGALGGVGHMLGSDPAAALEALGALDTRYTALRDAQFLATVQQLYGDLYAALGQFDFALGHYLKALEIARAHPGMLSPTAAALQVSIARVYTYTRAPDKILTALPDAAAAGLPPRARARVYLYRGIAEGLLGRPQGARDAYAQALAVVRAHGMATLQADLLANIADSYLQQHSYRDAEHAAREALRVAAQAGDANAIQVASANLGLALVGEGRLADGIATIDRVIAQMRKDGRLPDLADLLLEKSRALERAGRDKDALATLRQHEEIVGRLSASEREKTVAVLQEQFNAQQRAIQIEGLRRENAVKDRELRQRRLWQSIASGGAALALLLCGFVFRLYRRSRRTQSRLEELNVELAFHSTHDALTGLLNRRSFREHMLVKEHAPGPAPAACFILLDLDHFKAINDRHGHAAGDAVLVEAARRLRACVGARGLAMRWGGEEFLVYVDSIAAAAHVRLVRELLDALAGSPAVLDEGAALTVTMSAGALSLPARVPGAGHAAVDEARDWQQAVALADRALYLGKQGGRNRAYLIDAADPQRPQLILPSAAAVPLSD